MRYHASGEHLSPCGLYDSLCTLRAGRSTVCLSFPVTQHSVRVVGYSFPDRDSHPVRNTRLGLAHTSFTPFTNFPLAAWSTSPPREEPSRTAGRSRPGKPIGRFLLKAPIGKISKSSHRPPASFPIYPQSAIPQFLLRTWPLTATRKQFYLRDQTAIKACFEANRPKYVFLVAGTLGGIKQIDFNYQTVVL